ncbi:alpha/beta fold hydrolase [Hyphobacterium sp.]|jgi:pimeloyl-ACP methyl ester carboxylesterase|uniref:alpha/beta fold hydrolase n=1 Tax=Hyphobacterium sp. TaxID=2004662 RepID=UPI003BA912A8
MTLSRIALMTAATLAVGILGLWALASRMTEERIAQLRAERSLVETRHGMLEYSVWGDGPPVLVVHGAGGGFDQGRLLAEAIAGDGFTFISVSRFGYLGSDLPEDASTRSQAEAFVDLLDRLELDQVHVLAMSGGVPPSLKFAELYPERAGGMVLLSSAPFTPFSPDVENRPLPTWAYSALMGNDVAYWILAKIARGWLREAFDARSDLIAHASPAERDFVERLIDGFLPASRRLSGVNNESAAVDPEMTYDLGAIQSRVLIIHTRDDRLNPIAVSERLSSGIGNSEFIGFETGGHLLLGHHEEVEARLQDVFARLR